LGLGNGDAAHIISICSAVARKQPVEGGKEATRLTLRLARVDIMLSLTIAPFINGTILILTASAFYAHGLHRIAGIEACWPP
jgi:Mn2+/Fe2+ NRAMP family transporter